MKVSRTPLLYESHMHTPLCKHATGDPEEYAAVAHARGLKGIIVTCHNPVPGFSPQVRMELEQWDDYLALVERARNAWQGRIDVRLGLESDYMPGMEDWVEKLHARAPLNHVLGSVHPQTGEYRKEYFHGDVLDFQKTYFTHLAMAAETKLFDTLSHPDLVKNCFPTRWRLDLVMDHIRRCLDRIAKTGTAMELNTSGLNKDIEEMNPGPEILKEIHARKIPVVIGADAHRPERVAADFELGMDMLSGIGFTHINFFLERKRIEIPISEARASLIAS